LFYSGFLVIGTAPEDSPFAPLGCGEIQKRAGVKSGPTRERSPRKTNRVMALKMVFVFIFWLAESLGPLNTEGRSVWKEVEKRNRR
jgi:hypothetical protein